MNTLLWKDEYKKKIIEPKNLLSRVTELKKTGAKIVTLNGSFDLLHAGHLQILFEAKAQGDILIVALNTDSSIKRYKSDKRPLIPLEYRLQMMAALSFIDYVTYFDETDPCELLKIIQPAVHVNGSEYLPRCLEADVVEEGGGTVYYVKRIPGLATSDILKKIQSEVNSCAS